jgi:hypothetical protein
MISGRGPALRVSDRPGSTGFSAGTRVDLRLSSPARGEVGATFLFFSMRDPARAKRSFPTSSAKP